MSDYIKREDAVRAIMEYIRDGCDESDEFIDGTYKAKLIVEEDIPSADVVEVVRCKDCKYALSQRAQYGDYWCKSRKGMLYVMPDNYCSYGECKDGEKE